MINWIGSESSMIYNDDDEETKSPTTQSEGQSTGSENNSHDEVKIAKTQIAAENVILTYEEGPTPQEFFVPYLWSVVVRL